MVVLSVTVPLPVLLAPGEFVSVPVTVVVGEGEVDLQALAVVEEQELTLGESEVEGEGREETVEDLLDFSVTVAIKLVLWAGLTVSWRVDAGLLLVEVVLEMQTVTLVESEEE